MEITQSFYYLIFPVVFGGGGSWLIARYGSKLNFVDRANTRSSHSGTVPKGGGIGILVTFIFVSVLLELAISFYLAAVFLSMVSFLGDRFDLPVILRLFIQIICATSALVYFFPPAEPDRSFFLFPILVIFISGTANIYNFMDGIDGIAGIAAVIAFGLLCFYSHLTGGDDRYTVLAAAISLSSFSFLFFNIPKARVFMGDVGSVLLGFVFALVVIVVAQNAVDFLCMAGFLFLFYFDEFTTMVVRLKDRESLIKPHRRHLYQLLANEMGLAHWKISIGYGGFQLIIGLAAIILSSYGIGSILLLYVICGLIFIILSTMIRKKVSVQ